MPGDGHPVCDDCLILLVYESDPKKVPQAMSMLAFSHIFEKLEEIDCVNAMGEVVARLLASAVVENGIDLDLAAVRAKYLAMSLRLAKEEGAGNVVPIHGKEHTH